MFRISIKHNFPEVIRQLKALPDEVADKAMARSLNTTVDQAKPAMAREISKEFLVSVAEAKKRLYVSKARRKGGVYVLEAALEARRPRGLHGNDMRGMGIINFVEKSTTLAQARKRAKAGVKDQVFFQIKRQGGKRFIRGAFIATNKKTGGTALFVREGKARYPIKVLTTIDIPTMFNTERINVVVRKAMLNRFEANFQRELRAVLGGFVK